MNIWAQVKKLLCENGFLECDGKSKYGRKCFSFRLGPKLQDAEWRRVAAEEETNRSGKARSMKVSAASFDSSEIEWRLAPCKLPAVCENSPSVEGLTIDATKAHKILDEIAENRNWSRRTLAAWHSKIDSFTPFFHIGSTGRLFTDGNMLPREVRAALLIDGQETVEIDVRNCQPLLLATIYKTPSDETKRWQDLCESGQVYEHFAASLGMSRTEAKGEHFLPFVFGGDRPLAEFYFQSHFPELLDRIKSFPRRGRRSLAHVLQSRESGIIVEGVCGALKALSVHDAVRVKKSDEAAAREKILDLFDQHHRLRPALELAAH